MSDLLNTQEQSAVAEIATVSMGAAASTLGMMIGKDVEIVPQTIDVQADWAAFPVPFDAYERTLVAVNYIKGFKSSTVFLMRSADIKRLTALLMGEPEPPEGEDAPLDDMAMAAAGELMNQMMNAAATGLASMLNETVEIANPAVVTYTPDDVLAMMPSLASEGFVVNQMMMSMDGLAPFEMFEFRSISDTQNLVAMVEAAANARVESVPDVTAAEDMMAAQSNMTGGGGGFAAPQAAAPAGGGYASPSGGAGGGVMPGDPVTVRPVQFSSFDQHGQTYGEENRNLSLVMDVTLNLSVELGKTNLPIREILELTRGSVIELDRVAGEPVDLMANGKLIAKGEVVVIEDNFGLRITSIISPAERLKGL